MMLTVLLHADDALLDCPTLAADERERLKDLNRLGSVDLEREGERIQR